MSYSSIIKRGCKGECGRMPDMGARGWCFTCKPEYKEEMIAKHKKRTAAKNASSKISKLPIETKAPKDYAELDRFFKDRMATCEIKCENCGATNWWLENNKDSKVGKLKWRSCQAHLLPKRHFISIKTHPLNAMVLGSGYSGLCNCHDNYDASWDKAAKMNIWDEVVRRFLIMYPLITQEEQRFIPPQLLQEINQI